MDLFSAQQAVWSEIWPASGMTRNGVLSELPTLAPLISESDFLLLATPQANLGSCGGSQEPEKRRAGGALGELGRPDRASGALIPTPTASDHKAGRHQEGTGMSLSQAVQMLPTPQATNATASSTGYGANLHEVARELLPTPSASDAIMGLPRTSGRPPEKATKLATRIEYTDFGMYAPAIARWEQVLGRPAPAPTVPPTREGGRARLSTKFVEWLMGLPDGHVTGEDLGLTREQQLRLLGNGVVPQQGAAAIYQLTKIAIKEAA